MFTVGAGIFKNMVGWDLGAIKLELRKQVPLKQDKDNVLLLVCRHFKSGFQNFQLVEEAHIELTDVIETGQLKDNQAGFDNSNT